MKEADIFMRVMLGAVLFLKPSHSEATAPKGGGESDDQTYKVIAVGSAHGAGGEVLKGDTEGQVKVSLRKTEPFPPQPTFEPTALCSACRLGSQSHARKGMLIPGCDKMNQHVSGSLAP